MGKRYTRSVGYNISTKSIGNYNRHVLDRDYKHPEQSEAEREAWQTAFNFSDRPYHFAEFLNVEEESKAYLQGEIRMNRFFVVYFDIRNSCLV